MKQTNTIISTDPLSSEADDVAAAEVEWRSVSISMAQHGFRLDRALVELVPEFSRNYLQQLMEAGLVSLNGLPPRKVSQPVKFGDAVVIELRPTPQSQAFRPESMQINIVYCDEHLMVIDKPSGMVVHPAPGNWSGTLLNGLLGYDPNFALVPRAGIVHRLDKDTSGLMVVARTRSVMDGLVQAIAAREVSRQYIALAHKPWVGRSEVCVDAPVGRDPRNRLRMAVVDMEKSPGKLAKTDIVFLGGSGDICFVRCILHTGRTHQIRVHMMSIGHPLVADIVYGGFSVTGMGRQALHACRLAFLHPITGESLVFNSPPPPDFQGSLDELGLRYNP